MTFEEPVEAVPMARAYVYCGDWVADCPRSGCGNVEFLYTPSRLKGPRDQRRGFYLCSYCGMQSEISWPRQESGILAALMVRPVPSNRNWYPQDHPVAVNFRIPHGQSISDLLEENDAHGISNESVKGLI